MASHIKTTLFEHPQVQPINCFICNDNLGEYTSHNNPKVREGLQVHVCLKCKFAGAEVKIFVRTNRGTLKEIT